MKAPSENAMTDITGESSESRILIVEDDPQLRTMLEEEIGEAGYATRSVPSAERALEDCEFWHPDVVLTDLRLPGADGASLLNHLKRGRFSPSVIIITAFGTIPQAVNALKAGADNFLTKPLDFDHLLICVDRSLELRNLRSEVERFRQTMESSPAPGLISASRAMQSVLYQVGQIAGASGPVTILGESGVGKELVAQAIHQQSRRRDGPFVAVNCAGIPEHLVESELFGHTAGAFTGAGKKRRGLFDAAEKGVLLLDEVADLPLAVQAKLLRALQNHTIRPVGDDTEHPVDVRVIAATNRELDEDVRENRFREDLYYRLTAFVLRVPPLRDRPADMELLAARFIAQYSKDTGKQVSGLSGEALEALQRYSFPGNVRELQNIINRAVTFSRGDQVLLEDLPENLRRNSGVTTPGVRDIESLAGPQLPTLEEMKRRYIQHVLAQTKGNKRRAAAILGIERQTLYRYLARKEETG